MQINGLTSYTINAAASSRTNHMTLNAPKMPGNNDLQDSVGKRISMNRTHKAGRLT